MRSFEFNLADGFDVDEYFGSLKLPPQKMTLNLPDGTKVELVNEPQLREQIAREIMENFDGGHTKGENDCSCQEDSDPCYFCGAKDYTGIAAAIARGEK